MPFDFAALGGAVTGLATAGINAWSQDVANKENRHFAEGVMQQQRKWALEDWDKQNAYNSPQQQMQRFKEAGLNPNLIYGQQNIAAPVRSTEGAKAQAIAPHIQLPDIQGILAQSQAMKQTAVQTDNMLLQRRLVETQILNVMASTDQKAFQTERSRQLFQTDLDLQTEKIRKTYSEADLAMAKTTATYEGNERANQQQPLLLSRLASQLALVQAQTENTRVTKDRIQASTDYIRKNIDLTEAKTLNTQKQHDIMGDIQESIIKKNLLIDAQKGNLEAQKELTTIKAKWREMGLSETFIENLFNTIKNFVIPKYAR